MGDEKTQEITQVVEEGDLDIGEVELAVWRSSLSAKAQSEAK